MHSQVRQHLKRCSQGMILPLSFYFFHVLSRKKTLLVYLQMMMARSCNRNLQYRRVGNDVGGSDVIIGSSDDDSSGRSSINGDNSPPATHSSAATAAIRPSPRTMPLEEPEVLTFPVTVLPPTRNGTTYQRESPSAASGVQVGKCVVSVTSVPRSTATAGSVSVRQIRVLSLEPY
jgi:hypothetical protein